MILGYWYYCVSYNLGVTLVRSPANTHVIYLAFAKASAFFKTDKAEDRGSYGGWRRVSDLPGNGTAHFVSHAFH